MALVNKRGGSATGRADLIQLGTALPNAEQLNAIVERWLGYLATLKDVPARERQALRPLLYEPYCRAVANRARIAREERQRSVLEREIDATGKGGGRLHVMGEEDPEVLRFLAREPDPQWTPDLDGWRRYLKATMMLDRWMRRRENAPAAVFPEVARVMHTLIVAGTGHGKSEAIKVLLHHYAIHSVPRAGVIVLDPGRNLAQDIARWPILHRDRRVIYVEPELRPGLTVGINPFAGGPGMDDRTRNSLAATIGLAVSEMTADLSPNMKTLVGNLAMVLLDRDDATMQDLGRMAMKPADGARYRDTRRETLIEAGDYHRDPDVRDFFRNRFDAQTYAASRDALAGRIDGVTSMLDVRNTLFGPATLDLERELNAGAFILVNLNKYGEREQRAAVGRMLVALVAGIANRRGQTGGPYTPIHLVVDEVTAMASAPMIWTLAEQRKFGLHATLAQQVGGAAFTADEAHALIENTRCRLIASGSVKEGAALLQHRGSADELPSLSAGQFWVRWEGVPGVHTVQVAGHLVVRHKQGALQPERNREHWLPDAEWAAYVDRITAPPEAGGYYRPARTRALHTDTAPAREAPASSPEAPSAAARAKRTPGRSSKVPAYQDAPAQPAAQSTRKTPEKSAKKLLHSGTDDDEPR